MTRLHLVLTLALLMLLRATALAQEPTVGELTAAFSAKVLASAVFVSGREVDEALENSVYPFAVEGGHQPEDLTSIEVDRQAGTVTVTYRGEVTCTAKYFGDQGCVILPRGSKQVYFTPVKLESALPDAMSQNWPMGDRMPESPPAAVVDSAKLEKAVELVTQPEIHTAAFLVVHKGRIISETYGEGATKDTPLESWSMGKSLTAILYGLLVRDEGPFDPFVSAPIEAWQAVGDARGEIQVAHLLQMSSGLKFSSRSDAQESWDHAHPDHSLVYSGAIDVFDFSLSRPPEHPPGKVGRYRNCDPLSIGHLIKKEVESRGENYLAWPRKALFDKLGIRNLVLEPAPYGNMVMTGFEYGSARDWARLGMLMLADGVWQGERLLPEGFVEFVSTPAPAWDPPVYGGLFWVNATGRRNLPETAYNMAGHGGQLVFIVPTHDLVIVRMGHLKGAPQLNEPLNQALGLIVEAVE